jgi:hypothetical protein
MKPDAAKSRLPPETNSVDHAINRVLGAEAAAREALAACEREAAERLSEAEAQVRSIAQRAERRMQRAQRIADRGIDRALAELRSPLPDAGSRAPLSEDSRVIQVAAALADELTRLAPLLESSFDANATPASRLDNEVAERS